MSKPHGQRPSQSFHHDLSTPVPTRGRSSGRHVPSCRPRELMLNRRRFIGVIAGFFLLVLSASAASLAVDAARPNNPTVPPLALKLTCISIASPAPAAARGASCNKLCATKALVCVGVSTGVIPNTCESPADGMVCRCCGLE